MSTKLDRLAITNMPVRQASVASMKIIDAIQSLRPHEQVAGMAATFLLLAEHLGMTPQDIFAITTNIMNHAEGRRPEFAAVAQYMAEEL